MAQGMGMGMDSTGKQSKARVKEGDALIPKTSFKPIAAPNRLHGLKYSSAQELLASPMLMYEDIMRIFVAAKIPITLWGPMGSAKTRSAEALAELTDENGVHYQVITVQPSTQDPTTLMGLMHIKEDPTTGATIMERSIPEVAEQVWRYYNDKDGLTIMFLDEMTTCISAQQNAMLGLLTHGTYGNMDISQYTTFIMAANPPGTVQTVLPLSEAIINRGGHIPWYTDGDRFINIWETGFGNPSNAPREKTFKFIKNLIAQDPDIAFRDDPEHHDSPDDMWDIDQLCPYDQMHFSARAATEMARAYDIVQDTFAKAPFDIRQLYVQEVSKAWLGPRWSRHAGLVEEELENEVGTRYAVEAVNSYDVKNSMTTEEVTRMVGDSLHRLKGKRMRAEQERELAELFEHEIFEGGSISIRRYIAFWLWMATSPDEATRVSSIPVALRILMKAGHEYKNEIPKDSLLPRFVPNTIRSEMNEIKTGRLNN